MSKTYIVFLVTVITVFFSIFIECLLLYFQLKKQSLAKLFNERAFIVHRTTVTVLWVMIGGMLLALQSVKHPLFLRAGFPVECAGAALLLGGAAISTRAYLLLGAERSAHVNFFREGVPVVENSLYRYMKNPQYFGLGLMLAGGTLLTGSLFNLIITVEIILLLLPLGHIENMALK